jgi:hypothetical protein
MKGGGEGERELTVPSAAFLILPLLKPPFDWHGLLKSPCMAEWKLPKKWNSSTSPTAAVGEARVKVREPPVPASISMVLAATSEARVKRSSERMVTMTTSSRWYGGLI